MGATNYSHDIYAFGSNGSGQLGIGHNNDVSAPNRCRCNGTIGAHETIKHVACGGNHTMFMSENRKLLASTGENQDGRCMTTKEQQTCFLHVVAVPPVMPEKEDCFSAHIACTWSATIEVLSCRQPCVSGSGDSGELGLGPGVVVAQEPQMIHGLGTETTKVVRLTACMGHVIAVLSNGEVWGWGKGRKGQLGCPHQNAWSPRKIEGIPFFAVDAVCGKDFTCVFGLPSKGEFFLLGPNGNDRFGIVANAPASVPGWKQVAASWGSIYVLLSSGKLIAWGRDDHGQLPPAGLPPLKSIAAGSEHCLGLTQDGKVLAWGWGEHGNCGIPTDADGDVKGRWNEIAMSHQALAVFAGCATSFVATVYHGDDPLEEVSQPNGAPK